VRGVRGRRGPTGLTGATGATGVPGNTGAVGPPAMPGLSLHFDIRAAAIVLQKGPTRNSPGDEIANVNFLYDDIVHALQNTIDSCINSATDRRGYVSERMFTKFNEIMHVTAITPFNVIQGTDFGSKRKLIYNFLLVINTNLPPILHHLQYELIKYIR